MLTLSKDHIKNKIAGTLGNYTTFIRIKEDQVETSCNCPYPRQGCRHVIAACLNAGEMLAKHQIPEKLFPDPTEPYLSRGEIKALALADRKKRALSEKFIPVRGDMFKGSSLQRTSH